MGSCRGDALRGQAAATTTTRKDLRQSPKRLSKAGVFSSSSSSENPESRTSGPESGGGGHRRQSRDVHRSSVESNNLQRRTVAEAVTSAAETVTSAAETVRTSVISTAMTSSSTVTTATMTSTAHKQILSTGSTTSSTTSVEQHRNVLSHHNNHHHHRQHHHTETVESVDDQTGPEVDAGASDPAQTTVGQHLKAQGSRSVAPLPKDPSAQSRENPKDEHPSTGKTTRDEATSAKASDATSAPSATAQTGSKATEAAEPASRTASMVTKDGASEDTTGLTESVRIVAKTSENWNTTVATDSKSSAKKEQQKEKPREVSSSTTTESTMAQHKLCAATREKIRTSSTLQKETTSSGESRIQAVPETAACHIRSSNEEERTSRETTVSQTRESNMETKKQTSKSQKPAAVDVDSNKTPDFQANLSVESDMTKSSSSSSSASRTGSNVPDQSIRTKSQQKSPLHGGPDEKKIHSEIIQTTLPDTSITHSTAKQTSSTLTHKEYPV